MCHKESKFSVLSENLHALYLEDADSYSDISFLNFQLQIHFLGKFVPKRSKLFVLPENWHTWYLEGPASEFGVTFIPSRIKCRIPGTRPTYSPVTFTREHLGQIIFLHFSDSRVNMSAKSLVNMLANHW